jgi:hypothetical protein
LNRLGRRCTGHGGRALIEVPVMPLVGRIAKRSTPCQEGGALTTRPA